MPRNSDELNKKDMRGEEALALLRAIAADLAALRVAFERKQPHRRQDPTAAEIAELLRAIAGGVFGDDPFTTTELVARAQPPWPGNPRQLGKLFARIEGRDFEGLHVRRLGEEACGAIWKVERV